MENNQRAVFNFGRRITLLEPGSQYKLINKCISETKGLYDFVSNTLLEAFKRILTVNKAAGIGIVETDKQLVSCIIWEFAFPAMEYDYIIEKCILIFFIQLNEFHDTNYFDYAITSMINYCSAEELSNWAAHTFGIITENMISYCYIDHNRINTNHLSLLLRLAKYEVILGAWFRSDNVFFNLESIYFTHIPSKSDLEHYFPKLYYPDSIFPLENKLPFFNAMEVACSRCDLNELFLMELIRFLMDESIITCSNGIKIVPKLIIGSFLNYLIKKNVKYIQEFPGNRNELSNPSSIINIVFSF